MGNNEYNGEYIFRTTDPLGREVRLRSTTWDYHIVAGDHERTELDGEHQLVKSVIEDPYFILKNDPENKSSTRQKYMDIVQLDAFDSLKNLVIVVDHSNGFGDVVTVIPKSRVNQESTKGGPIYVRGKSSTK
jgi:hypothetical protein